MPRNPKVRRTDFPVQPIQTHPRVNPLDALISMPAWTCLRDKPRRINSKAALTDRTVPPKGFPIPGASRPKAPRPGCRTSNPPEGWPSIRRTHGRSTYPKTRKPLWSRPPSQGIRGPGSPSAQGFPRDAVLPFGLLRGSVCHPEATCRPRPNPPTLAARRPPPPAWPPHPKAPWPFDPSPNDKTRRL